ncbi:hypothetical protein QFC19_003758 [Naganishia cerealis]|uniref:Uncharacterized protein n=1 Tax=Naganishia cerealis TaxID=610337 RepID=A0ACC2W0P8_9TREE|nr:hypothetical protein QFC19_003758 [Naganishia cerealis]
MPVPVSPAAPGASASSTKTFTLDDLKQHGARDSFYMLLHDKVYDVTKFLDDHPGGDEVMLEEAGKDATEAFEDVGHSDEARELLGPMFVGDFVGAKKEKKSVSSKSGAVTADKAASAGGSTTRHHPDVQSDVDMDESSHGYNYGELDPEEPSGRLERHITSPGEVVTSAKEFMRGHGTVLDESGEQVVATVAGTVERVNKLVSVKSVKSRYNPEKGDLVVGRITEVQASRWKVDANARQEAMLQLSSVNLPGGVQRRKVESDALKMREFLAEGDYVHVHFFLRPVPLSSPAALRILKPLLFNFPRARQLRNGQLAIVPASLIRRLKTHFYTLPPPCGPQGVDVILGVNGYIWVCLGSGGADKDSTNPGQGQGGNSDGFENELVYSDKNDDISPASRQAISRVCALIQTFARYSIPLTESLLMAGYEWCRSSGLEEEPGMVLSQELEKGLLADVVGIVDTDE